MAVICSKIVSYRYFWPTFHILLYFFIFWFMFLGEASGVAEEEKSRLLFQLQEKSSEVARLEKQVGDLQRMAELRSQGHSLLADEGRSNETVRLQVRTLGKGAHNQEKVLNAQNENK